MSKRRNTKNNKDTRVGDRHRPDYHPDYYRSLKLDRPAAFLFERAKRRAKDKGLEFDLELSDITIPKVCPILGTPIVLHIPEKGGLSGPRNNSPTLDRIDNTKGYIKGNILVCCWRANRLKSDGTLEEHKKIVKFMEKHHE